MTLNDKFQTHKVQLYNNLPLFGKLVRQKAVTALIQDASAEAIQILAEALASGRKAVQDSILQECRLVIGPRSIDTVCMIWAISRHPELTTLLSQRRWVASKPLKVHLLTALKLKQTQIVSTGGAKLVKALLEASDDVDSNIAETARSVLKHISDPEVKKTFHNLIIKQGNARACQLAIETQYPPPTDPTQQLLFYVITSQWSKIEQLKPDPSLRRKAYRQASKRLQKKIAGQAWRSGQVEWWDIVDQPDWSLLTGQEWQTIVDTLVHNKQWNKMWQLTKTLPLGQSINLLTQLKNQSWTPHDKKEQAIFSVVSQYVEQCQGQSPQLSKLGKQITVSPQSGVIQLAISPAGQFLALTSWEWSGYKLQTWNFSESKLLKTVKTWAQLMLIINEELLVTLEGQDTRLITLRQLSTGKQLKTLKNLMNSRITKLVASNKGQLLIGLGQNNSVQFWQLPAGHLLKTIQLHTFKNNLSTSDDGQTIIIQDGDRTQLWSLSEGHLIQLGQFQDLSHQIAISQQLMVTANLNDNYIQLRQLPDGHLSKNLQFDSQTQLTHFALSPNGKLLITAHAQDVGLKLWQLPEGTLLNTLTPQSGAVHPDGIKQMALSPDGHLLASIGYEGNQVWLQSLPDGTLLQKSGNISRWLDHLSFSADARYLTLTSNKNRTIRRWQIETSPLSDILLSRITTLQLVWLFERLSSTLILPPEKSWLKLLLSLIFWQRQDEAAIRDILNQYLLCGQTPAAVLEIAVATAYIPPEAQQQALFYFLTGQWDKYETLDFDQSMLKTAYETADEQLRQRIRQTLRTAGRTDFLTIISGRNYNFEAKAASANEADLIIKVLTDKQEWDKLWNLALELPLEWSTHILQILTQNSWEADSQDKQATFKALIPLAQQEMLTIKNWADFVPAASQRANASVPGRINSLAFSPHRPLIAIGTGQGKAVLWNFETAERVWMDKVEHSVGQITFTLADVLLFTERSNRVATPCGVYRYANNQVIRLGQHIGSVTALEAVDGSHFLTTGRDGVSAFWNLDGMVDHIKMATGGYWPRGASTSPDGQKALIFSKDIIYLLELPSLERAGYDWHKGRMPRQATFGADNQTLILSRAEDVFTLHNKKGQLQHSNSSLIRHTGTVQGLEMALNRSVLLTAGSEGQINFIFWPTRTLLGHVNVPGKRLTSLHVSPDGAFMAVGDSDASFSLWDLRSMSLPLLLNRPLKQAQPTHLSWLLGLIKNDNLPLQAQNTLRYLEIVLHHRFRYDIEISSGPDILVGEFDIELEG